MPLVHHAEPSTVPGLAAMETSQISSCFFVCRLSQPSQLGSEVAKMDWQKSLSAIVIVSDSCAAGHEFARSVADRLDCDCIRPEVVIEWAGARGFS